MMRFSQGPRIISILGRKIEADRVMTKLLRQKLLEGKVNIYHFIVWLVDPKHRLNVTDLVSF